MPFLIVLGGWVIVLGLVCIISTIKIKRDGQGIANWPKVGGVVTESFIYTHERKLLERTAVVYTSTLAYTYVVDGKMYTAHKRAPGPDVENSSSLRAKAGALIANLPVGKAVRVYYNPNAPDQSLLHVSRPIAHNSVLLFGMTNMVMGVLVVALAVVLM